MPRQQPRADKQKSGRTRKFNHYLQRGLYQAAWSASHARDTYLSACFLRMRARSGYDKAIFALAHQILLTAFTIKRMAAMGFKVTVEPFVPPLPSEAEADGEILKRFRTIGRGRLPV